MKNFSIAILALLLGSNAFAQPRTGEFAPDISLTTADGSTVKLSSLKGKIVLIDFWASWCAPCRQAIRELRPVYNKYNNQGFEIYGVSLDEDRNDWKTAIAQDKSNWLHVNDNKGRSSKVMNEWRIYQIPTSYLLDEQGKVVAVDPRKREIEAYLKLHLKNESTQ
ncbi:MAG TPA: TlpA disulfide reductase family protein [Chitinophagaceae bacterium]|nr:TlpA disulfide reductase family protein [Chitinophagaceae bacterium]